MDLLDASVDYDPSDFDPLSSPFRSIARPPAAFESPVAQQSSAVPDTPFTAAFRSLSTDTHAPASSQAEQAEPESGLLIDLCAPTPRPNPPRPLVLTQQSRPPPPIYAPPRNPSPLKQAHVADALVDEEKSEDMAFARDSPGQTAKKVGTWDKEQEEQATPVKARTGRWSIMREHSGLETARKPSPRSRSVSPVKDLSFLVDPDASSMLPSGGDDLSLLLDESPSFLLNTSHDAETTLASFAMSPQRTGNLSGIDEEEEGDESLGNILSGLSDSCIGGSGPSILPAALTSSTRHALTKSHSGRSELANSTATLRPSSPVEERDLLACSTASYRDHRDSPVRPRIFSLAAERAAESAVTPKRGSRLSEVSDLSEGESRRTSGGSSSGDVGEMLDRWQGEGVSMTDLCSQQPPSPLSTDIAATATATFEMGLISPIQPDNFAPAHSLPSPIPLASPVIELAHPQPLAATDKAGSADLISLSSSPPLSSSALIPLMSSNPEPAAVVVAAQTPFAISEPPQASTLSRSASGLERLQKKMEELRARSTAAGALASSTAANSSTASAVGESRASLAATPRPLQQPAPLDSTPLASSSASSATARPTSTARRPAFVGHTRSRSIPILEDAEEGEPVLYSTAQLSSSTSSLTSSTSSSRSSLIEFMDSAPTPATKMIRSRAMATPTSRRAPLAFATPAAAFATSISAEPTPVAEAPSTVKKPRTSLLPARSPIKSRTSLAPSPTENIAPAPLLVPGSAPRKEATRERLDRLKEERRLREAEGTGVLRSPGKVRTAALGTAGVGGLRRPAASTSRLPPPSATAGIPAPRTRLPLGARVAPPSGSVAARPSLAEVLAKKPSRYAFTPTVPRPATSATSATARSVGAGAGSSSSNKSAAGAGVALKRPSSIATVGAGAGSRIGKPTAGAPSRVAGLSARPNGAK